MNENAYRHGIDPCGKDIPKNVYQTIMWLEDELNAANAEIERLENLTASGIHTCSEQCQRPMCVMRRQLRDANAKITELEEQLENLKPGDFDPYDPA